MRFFHLLISFLLLTQVSWGANQKSDSKSSDRYRDIAAQIKLLGEVFRGVNQRYVDAIEIEDFIQAGIDGMLETLDPYTVYFDQERVKDLEEITKGEFSGVGIEIGLRGKKKELTVISPMEDTPASRIGIRAGDVIVGVDGQSTAGFTTADAAKVIISGSRRFPLGTSLTSLTI